MKTYKQIAAPDAHYMAGLFDGEGCIGIYERSVKHSGTGAVSPYIGLVMTVSNTHKEVIRHIKERCGGVVGFSMRYPRKRDGSLRRTLYRWSAQSKEAPHILRQIFPYLIVKRDQAALALEFAELVDREKRRSSRGRGGNLPFTPEQIAIRRDFVRRMHELKLL